MTPNREPGSGFGAPGSIEAHAVTRRATRRARKLGHVEGR